MQDNNKLWIALFLLVLYGGLVYLKLADSQGLLVLLTYAIKKLLDMHEDQAASQIVPPISTVAQKNLIVEGVKT